MKPLYEYNTTDYAQIRNCQKGIAEIDIQSIVESRICIHKRGMRFYFGGNKLADQLHNKCLPDSSRYLVVVMARRANEVITWYKNDKGARHIRKNPKRLR